MLIIDKNTDDLFKSINSDDEQNKEIDNVLNLRTFILFQNTSSDY